MVKLKPIDQQVVVIVGASSGIGRETALRFADKGARVIVAGRSQPELQRLVDEIQRLEGQATAIQCDTAEYDQVKALADRAYEIYGQIDTWVQLAAVSIYAPFDEISPEEFRRVIDVNLMGYVYGAKAALPYLARDEGGALIEVSSVEARRALPLHTPYTTSKFAIRGFLDALRMEVEYDDLPVSITNVMPASINTPLFDKAMDKLGVRPRPIPPVYEPEVVADVILYAARHPVREIYAGGAGQGLGWLQRISPRLADRMLLPGSFSMQETKQLKPADAPNNLFNHVPGFDTIQGSFTKEAKSVSLSTWWKTHPVASWSVAASVLAAVAVGGAFMASRAMQIRRQPKYRAMKFLAKLFM